MPTVNIPGVELVRAGTWNASTGRVTISKDDLADMATASRDTTIDAAPIKLGHVDPRFDGEPALGWVKNLRLSSDGSTLIGDLVEVPSQLADILPTAYPRRSVEIAWGTKNTDGSRRGAILTGLALLGVTPPAVKGLADVYRAAASDDPDTDAHTVALATDTGGIPAIGDESMHPANQHDHLPAEGQPMGATTKAAAEAAADETTDKPDEAVDQESTSTATDDADTSDDADGEKDAELSAGPRVVTLSQGQYDDLVRGATAGQAALAELDRQRRDGIITTALAAGKLRPADQQAWRGALDRDEEGTVALLATLPQIVPTTMLGSAHASLDPTDAQWDAFEQSLTGKDA